MEATATARDRDLGAPARVLARERLLWAAVAAFVGSALGLAGTFALASVWDDLFASGPSFAMFALAAPGSGEALAAISLAGVAGALWAVLPRRGRAAVCGGIALLVLLFVAHAVNAVYAVYLSTGGRWESFAPIPFPGLIQASFWGALLLPLAALPAFAGAAFLGHERRLGAVLCALCVFSVPLGVVRFLVFPTDPASFSQANRAAIVFGWEAPGVGLPEAIVWVLLGIWLARGARGRARGEEFRAREKANVRSARRLYEEGLGAGDASVVDDLVSEDLRDLKSGARGRLGMERAFSALRRSYPDLEVAVEGQEAEGDLVRTRLLLTGTDEGGVMWYPPTGRRVRFSAEFADRFRGGLMVEHSAEADTGELLRQLGHRAEHGEGDPPPAR